MGIEGRAGRIVDGADREGRGRTAVLDSDARERAAAVGTRVGRVALVFMEARGRPVADELVDARLVVRAGSDGREEGTRGVEPGLASGGT